VATAPTKGHSPTHRSRQGQRRLFNPAARTDIVPVAYPPSTEEPLGLRYSFLRNAGGDEYREVDPIPSSTPATASVWLSSPTARGTCISS